MKNKLEPWEENLAGQLKEHEFSFDPTALAGFESLLAAETAVAGEAAPAAPQPTAVAKYSGLFTGKLLTLLVGALILGGLLTLALCGKAEVPAKLEQASPPTVVTPEQTTNGRSLENAPELKEREGTTLPLNPALPPAAAPPETSTAAEAPAPVTPMIGSDAPQPREERPKADLPRPEPTSGSSARFARSARVLTIAPLPTLRSAVVKPLSPVALPTVTIRLEPVRQARDRNTLFPEVIDN